MTVPVEPPQYRLVILDSGPLGLLAMDPEKKDSPAAAARCVEWAYSLVERGTFVMIPEIIRYELRRELARARLTVGLERLDRFCRTLGFLPIADGVMDRASDLWADVRRRGLSTARDEALDIDAILAAQTLVEAERLKWDDVVVATPNFAHLVRFPGIKAEPWENIL